MRRRCDGKRARLDVCGIVEERHIEQDELPGLEGKPFGLLQSKFVDVPGYDTVSEAGGGEAGDRHRIENVKCKMENYEEAPYQE